MKPTFTLLLFLFIQSFTVKAQVSQWNGLQSYRDTELDVIITFKGDNSNIGNQFSTRLQIESFTIFSLKYNGTVYNGNNTDLPFPFKLYRDVAATTQFTQNIPGASGEMNETQSVYSNFSVPFLYDHQRWDEMDQPEKEKVRESWRSQFPFQSRVQVTSIKGVGISQVVGKVKALVSKRESEKRQFDALVERYNNATTWPQFEQIVEIIDGYDWPGAYRQKTEEIKRNCLAKIAELKNKEHDTKSSLTVESSHSPTPSNENHGNSDGNTSNSSASAQHASNGGTSMEDGSQSSNSNSREVQTQRQIDENDRRYQEIMDNNKQARDYIQSIFNPENISQEEEAQHFYNNLAQIQAKKNNRSNIEVKEARKMFNKGIKYLNKEKYQDARAIFDHLEKAHDDKPYLLEWHQSLNINLYRIIAYIENGNQKNERLWEIAFSIKEEADQYGAFGAFGYQNHSAKIWMNKYREIYLNIYSEAVQHYINENYSEAAEYALRAYKLKSEDYFYYFAAAAYANSGMQDKAIEMLEDLLDKYPYDDIVYKTYTVMDKKTNTVMRYAVKEWRDVMIRENSKRYINPSEEAHIITNEELKVQINNLKSSD